MSEVEYALVKYTLLIHYAGDVRQFKFNSTSKDDVVKTLKRIPTVSNVPFPVSAMVDVANDVMKDSHKGWGVQEFALDVTSGFMVDHPAEPTAHKINLANVIMDLNDKHKWTREQIADWLDSLPEQPVYKMNSNIITEEDFA